MLFHPNIGVVLFGEVPLDIRNRLETNISNGEFCIGFYIGIIIINIYPFYEFISIPATKNHSSYHTVWCNMIMGVCA